MDDSTAATPVPSGQPFLAAPPKPEKIAITAIISAIGLGAEIALPVASSLIAQLRGGGDKATVAGLLQLREGELVEEANDSAIGAIMDRPDVGSDIKYCIRDLTRQVAAARRTMALCAKILEGGK